MRKFTQRKFTAPGYVIRALEMLKPPEQLTVSQWAERYRILSQTESALPGLWKNENTPYLVGIMDELNSYDTEEIIFAKPTQVGGTVAMLNMMAWIVDMDPSPTMVVYPSDDLAESTSENRIRPMLRDSPRTAARYHDDTSQRRELRFDGMYISLTGANSPARLASKPIRYLFLDEVDKFPTATKKEADPISLSRERTKTYANRKIVQASTPTLRGSGIWKAKEEAEEERHYFVPCPHCGKWIELIFGQLKFPPGGEGISNADRADQACYVCQECGSVITDGDKALMLRRGQWRAVRKAPGVTRTVAFWMNTLYSPFTRFSEIAKKWLDAQGDPDQLHNFVNSWLAEPWEETATQTDEQTVLARQTDLPEGTVPAWAQLLTGGVDVQQASFYWTIRAWGENLTSQCVARGNALSWEEIERAMNRPWPVEGGGGSMIVDRCLIDSGDQTDMVYQFCATRQDWAFACKGASKSQVAHYRITTVNRAGSQVDGMRLVLVDGGKYKDMIAGRMRRENGSGSWMVFRGIGLDYAMQVTSEHKITERTGSRETSRWVQKTSHRDNHYLDAEVYAMCAADLLDVRTLYIKEQEAMKPETRNGAEAQSQWTPEEQWIQVNENWV